MTMNRIWNCKNPYQGGYKKVLCVCSAGLLRSPTTAVVLNRKFNHNTRACGMEDYALIQIDDVLLTWADEIVCMDDNQRGRIARKLELLGIDTPIKCLDIGDNYEYMNADLQRQIEEKYVA